MKQKVFILLAINGLLASLLLGCSNSVDKAKQEEIARLKNKVCEYTRATGKDSVNTLGFLKYYGGVNSPEARDKFQQFDIDAKALEQLVGKWIDPETGGGWLKFCNS